MKISIIDYPEAKLSYEAFAATTTRGRENHLDTKYPVYEHGI